jgi:hypothetical protein
MKTNAHGGYAINITAKQASFLSSLMLKEKISRVQFEAFECWPTHPKVPCRAYGGFVGKKEDTSRCILKLKQTI